MLPDHAPQIDPADRPLLKPVGSLGRSGGAGSNVSFLRRTEYISSGNRNNPKDDGGGVLRANRGPRRPSQPKPVSDATKNTPEFMVRAIEKSFNLAFPADAQKGPGTTSRPRGGEITRAEKEAWERPRHPTHPDLTVIDTYPIVPDIQALGDSGVYMLLKYHNNPSDRRDAYDERFDVALLHPMPPTDAQKEKYKMDTEQYVKDPINHNKPIFFTNFNVFLPAGEPDDTIPRIKRKLDVFSDGNDDPALYTHTSEVDPTDDVFRYEPLRVYETYQQTANPDDFWNDSVAMALHDGETRGQKVAFVYPLLQKTFIRKDLSRIKTGDAKRRRVSPAPDEESVDVMEVTVGEFNDVERERVGTVVKGYDPTIT
jgi:RNA polymerase II-associated factor 1